MESIEPCTLAPEVFGLIRGSRQCRSRSCNRPRSCRPWRPLMRSLGARTGSTQPGGEGGASMNAKFTGRYRQGTGGRAGNSAQALSGSAPGSRSASAQTGPSDTAALTVSAGALTSREVYQVHPRWDLICHGRMNTAISRKTRGENPVRRADCTPRGGR
jgi:hypothetical protein